MKRGVLYTLMALAMALVVAFALAVPAHAADVGGGKTVVAGLDHPAGVYLLGQSVHYTLEVENPNLVAMQVYRITDSIPVDYFGNPLAPFTETYWWNVTLGEWVDEDPGPAHTQLWLPPGEKWTGEFTHDEIRPTDVTVHPFLTHPSGDDDLDVNIMVNNFFADADVGGTYGKLEVNPPVFVVFPDISVTKVASHDTSKEGDEVTYTICIENTGDWPLESITVIDSLLGPISMAFPDELDVGESYCADFVYPIPVGAPNPLINEVVVTGTAQGFDPAIEGAVVTDEAEVEVDLVYPELSITKSADKDVAKLGSVINYTVEVCNDGDVDLEVVVTDSLFEDPIWSGTIGVEECETIEYSYTVEAGDFPGPLQNTATAVATLPTELNLDNVYTRQDTWDVLLITPDVEIIKTVDPDSGGLNDWVTYTIRVENTGDYGLENIVVTDTMFGDITHLFGFDEPLLPDEWEEAEIPYQIVAADFPGPIVNEADVLANPVGMTNEITDDDDATVTLLNENLDVTKTVETYWEREHFWAIDKWVVPDNEGELEDGTPKIWLDQFDNEEECATWFVDVTYMGSEDSDFNVSGTITITNTGELPAVITGVVDELCGTAILVDWEDGDGDPVGFPYTLEVGDSIYGTYSEDVYCEGFNEVTVTTERDEYFADEEIVWGDPDEVINETVNIIDISDLFDDPQDLGSVTAPDGDTFEYEECFAFEDYDAPSSHTFNNTATIVETQQSASAILKLNVRDEKLEVSKTVVTYWEREHFWDIDKWVEPDEGEELEDGTPKIWLDRFDNESECATWYVDVTYEGFNDHGHIVSGTVTIENVGDLDAVITGVEDLLGGTLIDVDFGVEFPYTLAVGEVLHGTYSEEGEFTGDNVVTVTTARDMYGASEPIIWGDPDEVVNETVNIEDLSDLNGLVALGSVTAPDGDTFEYEECFAFEDYDAPSSHTFNNTATIVETQQSASAILKLNVRDEKLEVSKTVVTYFEREHFWDIDKRVETEFGHTIGDDEDPKIWLYRDGSGDECATWYVDVTYEGWEDSAFSVSGTVTVTNVGDLPAVITGVVDELCGTPIDVDWEDEGGNPVGLPYTLAVGESIYGTYSEDVYCEGFNEVTVTTERDEYFADEEIVWGDPDVEINATVNIEDDSDLFGVVPLGSVTAPNGDQFTYGECFTWTDYDAPGPYEYNNTATIVETGQFASAILVVNWEDEELCWADETAWAYGYFERDESDQEVDVSNPNWDYVNNRFWGWTNGPLEPGFYAEWPLYAGAGQNDLSKGEIVGWVTVSYYDDSDPTIPAGCVEVIYQVEDGYYLGETHLWVGNDVLPKVTRGRTSVYTNAPGQFPYGTHQDHDFVFDPDDPSGTGLTEWVFYACDFEGDIYIAAHAVVWMEVECPEEPVA